MIPYFAFYHLFPRLAHFGPSTAGPCRDVASGADRHLDIGLQVVKSSSLASVPFREAFSHSYISFFRLLVNGFSVIREYGSTLYVGLARAVSPTNTNFRLTFFTPDFRRLFMKT